MWNAWLASSVGWANALSAQLCAECWADKALAQPTNQLDHITFNRTCKKKG